MEVKRHSKRSACFEENLQAGEASARASANNTTTVSATGVRRGLKLAQRLIILFRQLTLFDAFL